MHVKQKRERTNYVTHMKLTINKLTAIQILLNQQIE